MSSVHCKLRYCKYHNAAWDTCEKCNILITFEGCKHYKTDFKKVKPFTLKDAETQAKGTSKEWRIKGILPYTDKY